MTTNVKPEAVYGSQVAGRVAAVAQNRVCEILQKKPMVFLVHRVLKDFAFWVLFVEAVNISQNRGQYFEFRTLVW